MDRLTRALFLALIDSRGSLGDGMAKFTITGPRCRHRHRGPQSAMASAR